MPDIKLLNTLTVHCKTIDKEREDEDANCSTDRHSIHDAGSDQCCASTGLERSCTRSNSNVYCYTNTGSNSNLNKSNAFTQTVKNNDVKYFLPGSNHETDRRASTEITEQLQRDSEDVFNGIGCFGGKFSLQLKLDSKPYKSHLRHVAYALQEPFKEELERLQQQDTLTQLGIDETVEWCNSILVPEPKGKVRLCLDPASLN